MSTGSSTLIVVSAIVRREAALLLVEQQGAGEPQPHWMLPSGRLEPNETLLAGLERELAEETGLRLTGLPTIAFAVEVETDAGRWSAVTYDCVADGVVAPRDPDRLVRSAGWVEEGEALARLRLVEWYDCIPLARFLAGDAPAGTVYRMVAT